MENLITCKVCGKQSTRIYGAHLKKHGLTSEEYLKLYPGSPLYTESDNKQTTKNSGKHMKQEKYRKMFSEKIRGENNPNSKAKTTEEERKSRSPFSKNFIKYKNENEVLNFSMKVQKEITPEKRPNRIEYWLNKGYSYVEAEKQLTNRQKTFSLKKCIEKYGEEKGREIFSDRQKKWQKSLNENGNLKHGFSRSSQILFYDILEKYDLKDHRHIFFATKNKEFNLPKKEGGIWIYDYTDIKNKKMIEYNGDEYHANPKYFEKNDISHPFRKQYTAEQIWEKDKRKLNVAEENGYSMHVVWDSEYRSHPDKILQECLDFLNV